jgi:hypothetical protein
MSRTHRPSAVLLALIAGITFGTARPSSAASITVLSDIFGIQAGTGMTLVEQKILYLVPRFDPGLGTLDGVSLFVIRGAVSVAVTVDSEFGSSAPVFEDDVTAVAFTTVSYSAGNLASGAVPVSLGPFPAIFLPPDSDGPADFTGSDALTFTGGIPVHTIDELLTTPAVLGDFSGSGLLLLTVEIRRLAGSTIPGIQELQAQYGSGVGVIGLRYEYTPATRSDPAVPEPGTFGLVGTVCAAAGLLALRRRALQGERPGV